MTNSNPYEDLNALNARLTAMGFRPTTRNLPKHQHMITVSNEAWEFFTDLAYEYHFTYGSTASVAQLLEAIGQGIFVVQPVWEVEGTSLSENRDETQS